MKMPSITVSTMVQAPVAHVWEMWNNPEHITHRAFASDDWHAPHAENDLRVGGNFTTTMAAKDNSASFDFGGIYTKVEEYELIEYVMGDKRHVSVSFEDMGDSTKVTETFETEPTHSEEQQRSGWQAILDNFKLYAEKTGNALS